MQQKTLLNFVTDAFVSVLWNSFTETLENMQKNMCRGVPFRESKTISVYSFLPRQKLTTVTFLEVSMKERMFHNFENSEKKPL